MHKVAHDDRHPVSILPRRELAMIAVQGPQARALLASVFEGIDGDAAVVVGNLKPFSRRMVDEFFIARTGYTGEDGCEVVLPADEVADLWRASPPPAWRNAGSARATRCGWKPA
jgi:aminomethyltransferase